MDIYWHDMVFYALVLYGGYMAHKYINTVSKYLTPTQFLSSAFYRSEASLFDASMLILTAKIAFYYVFAFTSIFPNLSCVLASYQNNLSFFYKRKSLKYFTHLFHLVIIQIIYVSMMGTPIITAI